MLVSVVIPAYNEENRIASTLTGLTEYFRGLDIGFELLVIDDGSSDRTEEVVENLRNPHVRIFRLPRNRGKGAAVRHGVERAAGEFVFFVDADLPYAPGFFESALRSLREENVDAVVGARDLESSWLDPSYPRLRVWMGKSFSYVVNALVPVQVFDTQCGFKGFRSASLRKALFYTQQDDYTLDIEVLLIFRLWKLRISRLPVQLVRHHGSKVRTLRDSISMLGSLLKIVRSHRRGDYPAAAPWRRIESALCPTCSEDRYKVYAALDDGFRFCRCLRCGTIYQNPRVVESLLPRQYGASYFASDHVCSGYVKHPRISGLREKTAVWIWDRVEAAIRGKVATALDVGCGSGEFLSEGMRRGIECWGVDLYQPDRQASHRFVAGDFNSVELPARYFDLVVFNDSFEHFIEPRRPLARCREILKPGGYVLLNIPDPDCWLAKLSGRSWISLKHEHLAIYPRQVLYALLEDCSFNSHHRFSSRQYADWTYLAPRLKHLFPAVSATTGFFFGFLQSRMILMPTGGMTVLSRLAE